MQLVYHITHTVSNNILFFSVFNADLNSAIKFLVSY